MVRSAEHLNPYGHGDEIVWSLWRHRAGFVPGID
nr:MAG TPA: hypothetical protein [Bacteriophage sp.]DAD57941.1 MAG TPA: hypothetical protein [Bacteriophage sp.]